MRLNWFKRILNCDSRSAKVARGRRCVLAAVEPLDSRVMLSVTASFSGGTLRVTGDDLDNVITVSRDVAGAIRVNGGAVVVQGNPGANVGNVQSIMMTGAGGNDRLVLDETNGPLPGAGLFGGDGNDVLIGGSGVDFADGGAGNDTVSLGAGDDTFQWNPGNGSDVVDGQAGVDTMVFNGSDQAEKFEISDSGIGTPFHRVRLTRDVGGVTMDLGGLESIELNALGGADTVTVDDLSGTELSSVNIDLDGAALTADGSVDAVVINGSEQADTLSVSSSGSRIETKIGLFQVVNIDGADSGSDTFTINALGGDDEVDASGLQAGVIGLRVNGGTGDDFILGSEGNDLISGGSGRDEVFMQGGDDTFTWNAGDGSDIVEGEDGTDTLNFNGSNDAENMALSAAGSRRTLVTDDVGNVSMDMAAVEQVSISPMGGADNVAVDDLTGTSVAHVKVKMSNDGVGDNVVVNGTEGADAIHADGDFANGVLVSGLAADVKIDGTIESGDGLQINGHGGNDSVEFNVGAEMSLKVDGGDGRDTIDANGTAANGVLRVLPSSGDDTVNVSANGLGAAKVSFEATQRIGALNIGSGGIATVTAGGAKVLTVTSLNISGTGTLNLRDNSFIDDFSGASPIANIQSLLKSGFNNGAWNGHGIISDLANASTFGLGFGLSSDVASSGNFAGQIVDNTAVVVKFTRYGDADLDGTVEFADLVRVAQNFGSQGKNWSQGDFNYDGGVDFSDLVRLAQNFGAGRSTTTLQPTSRAANSRPFVQKHSKI